MSTQRRNGVQVESSLGARGVLIIRFSNPPVNALSSELRSQLAKAVNDAHSRHDVRAIVLFGASSKGFFSSGADISEFQDFNPSTWTSKQGFRDEYEVFESGPKPVVAAIDGVCFGGGLELAMACSARVCTPRSSFSLPELRLGIIPGLGGTQRLPRLIGFAKGLQAMIFSETLDSQNAVDSGLVDLLVKSGAAQVEMNQKVLLEAAASLAADLADGTKVRYSSLTRSDRIESLEECQAFADKIQKSAPFKQVSAKGAMPQYSECVRVALLGVRDGPSAGLVAESEAFLDLVISPTSKGLVHLFFAQRGTASNAALQAKPLEISRAGVIGGGLMGAGIATVLLKAGLNVVIKEINEECVESARNRVQSNLKSVREQVRDNCMSRLVVTTEWTPFSSVDIAIEAALEDVKLKQSTFKTLADIVPSHCILATNTSTINLDLIAAQIPVAHYQEGRVVGLHFFSPAHIMPLVEIVSTRSTSAITLSTCIALSKRMKKTPVVVGNCAGFAVNRMYFPQGQVASRIVTDLGISPYTVDKSMEAFGLPMGAFRLLDLVGLDIGVAVNSVYDMAYAERSSSDDGGLLTSMLAAGRKGQKTGAGFYRYERGSRAPLQDAKPVNAFIQKARANVASRFAANAPAFSDQQIVETVLLPCVNEGCRILEENVVNSASDLDVCSVFGMGFPSYRGGLMYWAQNECGGPLGVLERLRNMQDMFMGAAIFTPSHALVRNALSGSISLGRAPIPTRVAGSPDDIVVVSAYRTPVGRAYRGGLKDTPVDDLVSPVVEKILAEVGPAVKPQEVDDLVLGLVLPRGDSGVVMLRVSGLLAGLPDSTPVRTVNRLCSSGLQAIADAAAGIQSGHYKIVIAGGAESMSHSPFTNKELKLNPRAAQIENIMGCYSSMGQTSENVAARYGIPRELQDRLAVVSHARASQTMLSGKQRSELVPIDATVKIPMDKDGKVIMDGSKPDKVITKQVRVERDEGVRVGVTSKGLAKLKPVFKKDGSTTAGNASQLSDGAAMVMLMSRAEAKRRGLKSRATLRAFAVAGVEPGVMGIGPAVAIPAVLEKAGLRIEDIDLFEINEAFGSQAEYCISHLGLNRDIVNVNGGAIAIGHPLGMTGARISVSIINELERRNARFGVVSMCIGTGMGAAAIYEITPENDTYSRL